MKTYSSETQQSSILGVCTAPGAPETTPKDGPPIGTAAVALTPTSYQYNHENVCSGTMKSSILGVWTAPGAPSTTPKGGVLRAPSSGVAFGPRNVTKFHILGPGARNVTNPSLVGTWPAPIELAPTGAPKLRLRETHENIVTPPGSALEPATTNDFQGKLYVRPFHRDPRQNYQ
jgi:hypothetical protein